ncbi:sugar-binding domain-containing protein [Streptomyces mirabilis]|uniref:sugar-binding domain-containing protein n=1 Tax=Streptomyces mirabilis TaxID=68239 RepID=UPI0036C2F0E0
MIGPFDTKNSQNGGSQVELRLDGVHQNADVWLNGVRLRFHPYGYTAFAHDLTPHLNPTGPNVLAVTVDNSTQNSRCYSGSGIYRHTWLTVTGPVRIPLWGVHVTTPEVSERRSVAHVEVSVANLGARPAPAYVRVTVLDPRGHVVATRHAPTRNAGSGATADSSLDLPIERAALWPPDADARPGRRHRHRRVRRRARPLGGTPDGGSGT